MELTFEPYDVGRNAGQHRNPYRFMVQAGDGKLAAGFAQATSPMMTEGWSGLGSGGVANKARRSRGGSGGGRDIGF